MLNQGGKNMDIQFILLRPSWWYTADQIDIFPKFKVNFFWPVTGLYLIAEVLDVCYHS